MKYEKLSKADMVIWGNAHREKGVPKELKVVVRRKDRNFRISNTAKSLLAVSSASEDFQKRLSIHYYGIVLMDDIKKWREAALQYKDDLSFDYLFIWDIDNTSRVEFL